MTRHSRSRSRSRSRDRYRHRSRSSSLERYQERVRTNNKYRRTRSRSSSPKHKSWHEVRSHKHESQIRHRSRSRSLPKEHSSIHRSRSPIARSIISDHHDHRGGDSYHNYRSLDGEHSKPFGRHGNNMETFFERRRLEREKICSIGVPDMWGVPLEHHEHAEDDSSCSDSGTGSDLSESSSSEEERKKKHKKKSKKHKDSDKKKKKKKSKSKKKKSKKEKKKKKKRKATDTGSGSDTSMDEEEKRIVEQIIKERQIRRAQEEEEETDVVGPLPNSIDDGTAGGLNHMDFGKALLPGEGAAMAAYIAEGKRIPRRGEIGLTSDEIVNYEHMGFVMSGSRHRRMEAVRLRKENQIYSADEKRILQNFNYEERTKRESKILSQFKELVHKKLHNKK
ncbi:hypothetical protein LSH36_744g01058 [Paralvinella palmiformis]|uniref:NF-kappa-B-activating protein C-terminal domain-containing protein n=1 Tax=Paralvinella palmiformis TaxID=53620 RepID=A0AAD9J1F5_9ANNE|nr:hypothetical protein LSH36_744g01058 [Paralvinella palmiformis]